MFNDTRLPVPYPSESLAEGFRKTLGRAPKRQELEKLERYLGLLVQWNRVNRLTGYRAPGEIAEKLLLDSLLFLEVLPGSARRVLDLGTGAGIPGIPVKIAAPHIHLTLIEARRRRGSFLALVVRELGLDRVVLLRGRAEKLILEQPDLRGAFDAVLSRGFGPLETTVVLAQHFLKPGGAFIASGPPVHAGSLTLSETSASWKLVSSPLRPHSRRFLVVEKARSGN